MMRRVQSTRNLTVVRYPWREPKGQSLDVQCQILNALVRPSQSLQHLTRLVYIPSSLYFDPSRSSIPRIDG